MGSNKNLFIILGVAVVALVATLMSGALNFSEGEDPAQAFINQRGGGAVSTPAPVEETPAAQSSTPATPPPATPAVEPPPVVADSEDAGADTAGTGTENPCAEGEPGIESDGTTAEDVADELVAGEGLDDATEVAAATDGGDIDLDLAAEAMDGAVPGDEELFLEDEVSDDPIERFKDMDPRDIIDAKYNDLEGRTTTPWNDEDWVNYVPMTGRPDPLTRIRDAIPEGLMPPREGATDDSEIQLYAASVVASQIVDGISMFLECYNVLQIGLDKRASFMYMGSPLGSLSEGSTQAIPFSTEGVNGNVVMMVISISSEQVTVNFSASADQVDLGISKTQHFIPSKGY